MDFISVCEFAKQNEVSERTVRNWCAEGKIKGAFLTGKTWNIPHDAALPARGRPHQRKAMPLLEVLREQKDMRLRGGAYHHTQIDMAYNSNHIEGSQLTREQTRYIFETNTIGVAKGRVNVDDIIETVNHFRCVDMIIDHAGERLTEAFVKELHAVLKNGTSDSQKTWFRAGEYKMLPNEVGGHATCPPEEVHRQMKALLAEYNGKKHKELDDIIDFHKRFEDIHPFQNGNGRVGRLLMFMECLANSIVPFIITDDLKMFYYRGLQNWPQVPGYLRDTCLTAQDSHLALMRYFKIPES